MRLNLTTGKIALALTLAVLPLTLSATAQAGNPSLCKQESWRTAQSSTGGTFASLPECAKAHDVYAPTLMVEPQAVTAEQTFTVDGAGFHASTGATLAIAVTGQPPYYTAPIFTAADGSFSVSTYFTGCGTSPPYELTVTVTDSYGVHASARMTLC